MHVLPTHSSALIGAILLAFSAPMPSPMSRGADAAGTTLDLASEWIEGHKNRVRLTAASAPGGSLLAPPGSPVAFVEIELAKGWKTYWRNPGPAGGLPPTFDLSGSSNLKSAEVLYPVPTVLSDQAGDVIGYKDSVTFPVLLVPSDASKPMALKLAAHYGICETVCVPVSVDLTLTLPPTTLPEAGPEARASLEQVPRRSANLRPSDPRAVELEGIASVGTSKVRLVATYPGGADEPRLFLDAPDGRFVPLPTVASIDGERVTFLTDFGDAAALDAVRGLKLTATLASSTGHADHTFVID